MTIVVTGATGNLGHLIVEALLRDGATPSEIVAGGRNVAKLDDLKAQGVKAVTLDYDNPATIASALEGADILVLVSSSDPGQRVPQHKAVIDAAVTAGVKRIVYTSAPKADTTDLVVAPDHKVTEELIAATGTPYTFLRNNWYHENYTGDAKTAAETGVLTSSVGSGRVASASRKDYADATAIVVLTDGHENKTYELSGDVAWNFDEFAAAISDVTGKPVKYTPISTEDHIALLQQHGLDAGTAGFVAAMQGNIRDGALDKTSDDLSTLLGHPTTPLRDALAEALA